VNFFNNSSERERDLRQILLAFVNFFNNPFEREREREREREISDTNSFCICEFLQRPIWGRERDTHTHKLFCICGFLQQPIWQREISDTNFLAFLHFFNNAYGVEREGER